MHLNTVAHIFGGHKAGRLVVSACVLHAGFGLIGVQMCEMALTWHRMRHRDRMLMNIASFVLLMTLLMFTLNGGSIDQMGHLGGLLCGKALGAGFHRAAARVSAGMRAGLRKGAGHRTYNHCGRKHFWTECSTLYGRVCYFVPEPRRVIGPAVHRITRAAASSPWRARRSERGGPCANMQGPGERDYSSCRKIGRSTASCFIGAPWLRPLSFGVMASSSLRSSVLLSQKQIKGPPRCVFHGSCTCCFSVSLP